MAAALTLCTSRKMLSSVSLLPMPLAFHCSMLNVLSDMVGVWAGLGDDEGASGCGGVLQAVQIQPLVICVESLQNIPLVGRNETGIIPD